MKKKLTAAITTLVLLLAVVCLVACNASAGKSGYDTAADNYYSANDKSLETSDGVAAAEETTPERKIIYYVYVDMSAEDVSAAVASVKALLASSEWADSESVSDNYGSVVVRVKTERLDAFLDGLSGVGNVTNTRKNGKDVSLDYSDTTNKIATLTAERAKLNELLGSASAIADVLAITKRIAEIDTELDTLNGVIRNYDSLVEYSTVTIYVSKTGYVQEVTFGDRLKAAFGTGWDVAESVFIFILVAIPFVAVIVLVIVGIVHLRRRATGKTGKKRRKKDEDDDRMDHIV